MYNVSQKFKDAVYAPSRRAVAKVTFDISDVSAATDVSSITTTTEASISNKAQLNSLKRNATYNLATLETNRFKLDGSMVFPDSIVPNNGEVGFVSSQICDANGSFVDITGTTNFVGKIAGSTAENPNIVKVGWSSSLIIPSGSWSGEFSSGNYSTISTLNGAKDTTSNSVNGNMVQELISFNLIEFVKRTYPQINMGADVASQVAWLKANVTSLTCNWYGWGSGPAGNKAYLKIYLSSSWQGSANHNNGTITKLSDITNTGLSNAIDSNGFVHYLAYADASNGTIASTINTDFVELIIDLQDPPKITIDFNSVHSSLGLTVTFDGLNNEYATDYNVSVYDAASALITSVDVTGNTKVTATPTGQLTAYKKVVITVKKWSKGNRRARMLEVDFGIVSTYTDDSLIELGLVEDLDLLSSRLPSPEFNFTVDNSNRAFNILNPVGVYKFLQQRQKVSAEIGLDIGGAYEWVTLGNYLLWEWKSDEGSLTTSFTARTALDIMSSFDYENLTAINNRTLWEIAVDLFKTCGIGKAQTAAYDQTWNTQPFTTSATTNNGAPAGTLNVTSTSADPFIDMTGLGSFNPSVYRYIEIKYRCLNFTNPAPCQIFYYNARYSTANAAQVVYSSNYINDGKWHVMLIDMWAHADWKLFGNITGWRWDWIDSISGATMEFDYIRLVDLPQVDPDAFYLDPALQTITTNGLIRKTTCKDALQMAAIAGCANVFVDRKGIINVKSVGRRVRYVRDWANGNTVDAGSHWVEIQAFDLSGVNQALNKTVTASQSLLGGSQPLSAMVDNSINTGWSGFIGLGYMQVDLGKVYDLANVKVWHYYADSRKYFGTKTEVSEDGITWYTIFDSAVSGTYIETSAGRISSVDVISSTTVDSITNDNTYKEPQIVLDKVVKKVDVTYWTNLSTSAVTSVSSSATLGDTLKLDNNTLINDATRAGVVGSWILSQKNKRAAYTINWRGNPAHDLGDTVSIQNSYGTNATALITKNELSYRGYLSAKTEARGVPN